MDASGNAIKNGAGKYVLGATGSAGTSALSPNLALNLIKGGWNVSAAQNIFLQEVRNPNGLFNIAGSSSVKHLFDYALSDFVNLTAGNAVQLGGFVSSLPRVDSLNVPVMYPGSLTVNAGAGGIKFIGDSIYNKLILFPSPLGGLVMNTTGGGSLVSDLPTSQGAPQIFSLIVSDSGNPQYKKSTSFGINDHAATPVHLNSEQPVELNISGDMNLMLLSSSEAAQVNVVGNMNNSRFLAMNLADGDVSSITVGQPAKLNLESKGVLNSATDGGISVGGNIYNRGAFTSVDLSAVPGANAPNLSLLARSQESSISVATLLNSIYYNQNTKVLTYQEIPGVSIASFVQLLQGLTVQKADAAGNLLWLDAAQTVPATEVVSVLNSETALALKSRYDSLGAVPGGSFGYAIGGGGKFKVTANNLDLGTTPGIQSQGVGFYQNGTAYPLANYFTRGADITVDLAGNLNMPSTSISSFNGGNIYVNALGDINVGSTDFSVTSIGARGIFATGLGNVGVYAGGNVDIQGSRIAVYDTRPTVSGIPTPGGSVTVVSRHGDVIVGSGGSGYVVISSYYVDPLTRVVSVQQPTIPGTGILQTSYNQTGNVLVEALAGNVVIGAGGIEQLLFKGSQTEPDLNALATLFRLALGGNAAAAEAYEKELNGIIAGAPVPFVDVYAGYGLQLLDAAHNPIFDDFGNPAVSAVNLAAGTLVKTADGKNIDATGSGIVGAGTANLKASGSISGNIISLGDVNLDAQGPIIVSVFGLGTVNVVSASGSISGTIIGVGGINASGSSIDANLESNGAISGETSGSAGFAASATSGNVAAGVGNEATTAKKSDDGAGDELNKKKKPVALAQKVSRVTVLLPKKN
jgi:hypothetical protein